MVNVSLIVRGHNITLCNTPINDNMLYVSCLSLTTVRRYSIPVTQNIYVEVVAINYWVSIITSSKTLKILYFPMNFFFFYSHNIIYKYTNMDVSVLKQGYLLKIRQKSF